jgi:HAMP domain-containing protein/uncharacterized protein YeeX (DUF496 family)
MLLAASLCAAAFCAAPSWSQANPERTSAQAPAKALEGAPAQELSELDDSELYFEAHYRRFFRYDHEGATRAYELLAKRRDSQYRRLALLRLLELHRDAMRYDELLELLKSIRNDRENGLPGVVRSELRGWMRQIERHSKGLERDVRESLRALAAQSPAIKPTRAQLERMRRELSKQRLGRDGEARAMLDFGSSFFARRLSQFTGGEPSSRAREIEALEKRIRELRAANKRRAAGSPAADPGRQADAQELLRLEQRLRSLQQSTQSSPGSAPAGDWHRAMIHRLQQKRKLRASEGRSALVRLYDERIQKHLVELGKIGVRELMRGPERRRLRILAQLETQLGRFLRRVPKLERGKPDAALQKELVGLRKRISLLRRSKERSDADWKKLEQELLQRIEASPQILEELLLGR